MHRMPVETGEEAKAGAAPWFCYVVACADGTLYTGVTNDLPGRLSRHNRGKASKYTRGRLPVRLVWSEEQASRAGALRREAQVKRLSRAAKLALIGGEGPRGPYLRLPNRRSSIRKRLTKSR
jgi:putative endonuclease